MKTTYEKPTIKIKHYLIQTTVNTSPIQVYDAGELTNTPQYTLGTLNS